MGGGSFKAYMGVGRVGSSGVDIREDSNEPRSKPPLKLLKADLKKVECGNIRMPWSHQIFRIEKAEKKPARQLCKVTLVGYATFLAR